MTELQDLIFIEKYRPDKFEDLILANKSLIVKYLDKPKTMPSFIFYSARPGTGKTSTAKIIIKALGCDALLINSSDERGIDTIRDKIKLFSRSLSTDTNIKRCIFLDEADGLTKQAQDSLRNLMEAYSDNCFFIFSCNDINKIIEPLRSRCNEINFEHPNKADIVARLCQIIDNEKLEVEDLEVEKLVDTFYPDIRSMIVRLQQYSIDKTPLSFAEQEFEEFLTLMKKHDVKAVYEKVYSGTFPVMEFNKWMFERVFANYDKIGLEEASRIVLRLADTEKYWNMGANLEIIFIANTLEIMKGLK